MASVCIYMLDTTLDIHFLNIMFNLKHGDCFRKKGTWTARSIENMHWRMLLYKKYLE